MIKKKMQMGGKAKSAPTPKGRPMGGAIGAYSAMEKKAKAGDTQAQADLKLEKAKLKTFGEGPGSGPSGAMPKPKKKMGGAVKKAENGGSLKTPTADQKGLKKLPTEVRNKMGFKKQGGAVKKAQMGATMTSAPAMMKKGGSMKKCKYGCK
jgi:hypothetical protein